MAKQLLIYEKAVPVTIDRHGDWSIKAGTDYSFAQGINSVPLTAVEFPHAASEYSIVFTGTEEQMMPAVILGMRDQENLYLDDDDKWQARYVPAFLRRYPFVFASSEDGKTFTLCIDEDFEGFNQDGRGEKLFDAEGEQTQYLKGVLAFLQDYQAQFQRTQAFCRKLRDLDLLEPMQAMFTLGTGEQTSLSGFMGIQRDRLKALSAEQLTELASTDELELAYLHLHSLRNLTALANRVAPPLQAPDQETTAPSGPADPDDVKEKAEEEKEKGIKMPGGTKAKK